MAVIKHKSKSIRNTIELASIFSRPVIAKDGTNLGKLASVNIHPKNLTIEGIWVEKTLFAPQYFGKNYIKEINKKRVLLKINPIINLIGMSVYDKNRKKVGNVERIKRRGKSNNFISLVVSQGIGEKDIVIAKKAVKSIGKTIILK